MFGSLALCYLLWRPQQTDAKALSSLAPRPFSGPIPSCLMSAHWHQSHSPAPHPLPPTSPSHPAPLMFTSSCFFHLKTFPPLLLLLKLRYRRHFCEAIPAILGHRCITIAGSWFTKYLIHDSLEAQCLQRNSTLSHVSKSGCQVGSRPPEASRWP